MPIDCCYFVDKAAAAGAAPALYYLGSIFHYFAVFTQNLGQTRGARGFFLAVLVTCLIGLPTKLISCWRTKEGPRLRAAEHPVCRHVSRDVLDSGAER